MIGLPLSLPLPMSHRRRRYDLVGIGFLLLLIVLSDLSLLVSSQEVDENITDTGTDTGTISNTNFNDMLNTNASGNAGANTNNDTGDLQEDENNNITDIDTDADTDVNTLVNAVNTNFNDTDTDTDTSTIIVKDNDTNNCFEVTPVTSSGGGCTDSVCENYICENIDRYCCTVEWDINCINYATEQAYNNAAADVGACLNDWPIQSNDCFTVDKFGRSGCADTAEGSCELLVCDLRPECCTGPYDQDCAELALKKCDLPTATNQCLVQSDLPGCDNSKCLESICSQHDESCCTTSYGPQCVQLARNDAKNCAPSSSLNTCLQESIYGGCNDRRCQALVCSVSEGCCNSELRIGTYNRNCVKIAESLCQPTILDKVTDGEGEVCPHGMTCDYDFMSNCTELATQYIEVFDQGNIFGGIYCGNTEKDGIENCPKGSYCPDPETMLPCPAGFFCPYKTQYPTMDCPQCKEGATRRVQDMYGYIVLAIIVALVVVYIGWGLLQRYNIELADRVHDLEKRFNVKRLQQEGMKNQGQTQKQVLEKLRPKLELIRLRLKIDDRKRSGVEFHGTDIKFDARSLFDVLDADGSGDVTFDELNVILGLSEAELKEFIRRMNEMADMNNASVTRPVFVKYFLQVLTDTSNLSASYEEAESIFDEMALAGGGDKKLNEIDMQEFYTSSMSDFLSDSQIFDLIKEFKVLKAGATVTTAAAEEQTYGLAALRMNRRGSARSISTTDTNPIRRRVSLQVPTSKTMMIGREVFIRNYPQLLMDVMLNEDGDYADDHTDIIESRGVDLCFTDLSLSIKLGKKKVDVVNKVTGRIRAKTMTALMGGSGAGKTSLLNALCGRAHYGKTTGTVYLNGHETSIEQHTDCIGFVPQDDTVYAELTVRENLIFSGKFRLPKGTTDEEIAELADETIANLGLSRVANSPVGDVRRRGVSGGEKKRVNIGLELMAMPSIYLSVPRRANIWFGCFIGSFSDEESQPFSRKRWSNSGICHSSASEVHL